MAPKVTFTPTIPTYQAAQATVPTKLAGTPPLPCPVVKAEKGNTYFNIAAACYTLQTGSLPGLTGDGWAECKRTNPAAFAAIDKICAEILKLNGIELPAGKMPSQISETPHPSHGSTRPSYDKIFHLQVGDEVILPNSMLAILQKTEGGAASLQDVVSANDSGDPQLLPEGVAPGELVISGDLEGITVTNASDGDIDGTDPTAGADLSTVVDGGDHTRGRRTRDEGRHTNTTRPGGGPGVLGSKEGWLKKLLGGDGSRVTTSSPGGDLVDNEAERDARVAHDLGVSILNGFKEDLDPERDADVLAYIERQQKRGNYDPEAVLVRAKEMQADNEAAARVVPEPTRKQQAERYLGHILATEPRTRNERYVRAYVENASEDNPVRVQRRTEKLTQDLAAAGNDDVALSQVLDQYGIDDPNLDRRIASNAGVLGALNDDPALLPTGGTLPETRTARRDTPRSPRPERNSGDTRTASRAEGGEDRTRPGLFGLGRRETATPTGTDESTGRTARTDTPTAPSRAEQRRADQAALDARVAEIVDNPNVNTVTKAAVQSVATGRGEPTEKQVKVDTLVATLEAMGPSSIPLNPGETPQQYPLAIRAQTDTAPGGARDQLIAELDAAEVPHDEFGNPKNNRKIDGYVALGGPPQVPTGPGDDGATRLARGDRRERPGRTGSEDGRTASTRRSNPAEAGATGMSNRAARKALADTDITSADEFHARAEAYRLEDHTKGKDGKEYRHMPTETTGMADPTWETMNSHIESPGPHTPTDVIQEELAFAAAMQEKGYDPKDVAEIMYHEFLPLGDMIKANSDPETGFNGINSDVVQAELARLQALYGYTSPNLNTKAPQLAATTSDGQGVLADTGVAGGEAKPASTLRGDLAASRARERAAVRAAHEAGDTERDALRAAEKKK